MWCCESGLLLSDSPLPHGKCFLFSSICFHEEVALLHGAGSISKASRDGVRPRLACFLAPRSSGILVDGNGSLRHDPQLNKPAWWDLWSVQNESFNVPHPPSITRLIKSCLKDEAAGDHSKGTESHMENDCDKSWINSVKSIWTGEFLKVTPKSGFYSQIWIG